MCIPSDWGGGLTSCTSNTPGWAEWADRTNRSGRGEENGFCICCLHDDAALLLLPLLIGICDLIDRNGIIWGDLVEMSVN